MRMQPIPLFCFLAALFAPAASAAAEETGNAPASAAVAPPYTASWAYPPARGWLPPRAMPWRGYGYPAYGVPGYYGRPYAGPGYAYPPAAWPTPPAAPIAEGEPAEQRGESVPMAELPENGDDAAAPSRASDFTRPDGHSQPLPSDRPAHSDALPDAPQYARAAPPVPASDTLSAAPQEAATASEPTEAPFSPWAGGPDISETETESPAARGRTESAGAEPAAGTGSPKGAEDEGLWSWIVGRWEAWLGGEDDVSERTSEEPAEPEPGWWERLTSTVQGWFEDDELEARPAQSLHGKQPDQEPSWWERAMAWLDGMFGGEDTKAEQQPGNAEQEQDREEGFFDRTVAKFKALTGG
jgi:hypothetical protein